MIRLALPLLALAAGCTVRVPDHGVYVGNPGSTRIRVAALDKLEVQEVTLSDGVLTPVDCEGAPGAEIALDGVDQEVDIELPPGTWCGLDFDLELDTFILAEAEAGGVLTLPLEIQRIELASDQGVDLQSHAWLLELGEAGWISAAEYGVSDEDVTADPHSTAAEAAADVAEARSGLYRDLDRDGAIDADDRGDGPVMVAGGR